MLNLLRDKANQAGDRQRGSPLSFRETYVIAGVEHSQPMAADKIHSFKDRLSGEYAGLIYLETFINDRRRELEERVKETNANSNQPTRHA